MVRQRKIKFLKPQEIVDFLDRHIVGQKSAKRAIALALRNRWRRGLIEEPLRSEVQPKNLLLIGPTGVGKTEIARRVAGLAGAPFIKVEATKFTEVGYIGKDVESIILDLLEVAIRQEKEKAYQEVREKAHKAVVAKLLDYLVPVSKKETEEAVLLKRKEAERQLVEGKLDNKLVELEVPLGMGVEIVSPPGMEEIAGQLQRMLSAVKSDKAKKKEVKVGAALQMLMDEELSELVSEESIYSIAKEKVEQNGIVFLDEIDKIITRGNNRDGAEVSREGVQRDLLPLIEGTTVNTKYGSVKTEHILFIAAGAFHLSKPSDLIPELQGRFPVRVELSSLAVEDFIRILKEPQAALLKQYIALLQTEGITLRFEDDGIRKIAEIAFKVNEKMENIGARRLYTVMEQLLEEVSFDVGKKRTVAITGSFVEEKLAQFAKNEDLSRYIL